MNESISTYKVFAQLYDQYVGGFDKDLLLYSKYCQPSDKVVEIGCGTGRILTQLLNSGVAVCGVDISVEMLDLAANKLEKYIATGHLDLLNLNFSQYSLKNKFSKALLTFYTFNYILDEPLVFLKNVWESLSPEGILIMDLFYPNSLRNTSIDDQWILKEFQSQGKTISIKDKRKVELGFEYRTQIYNIDGFEEEVNTKRKYYSPTEMASLLKEAGYREISFNYGYTIENLRELKESSLGDNFIVIAKK